MTHYDTDIKRVSEVAEVRDVELGREDNWLRIDYIPKRRGVYYKVVINRKINKCLIGNYHGVLRKRMDGKYRLYLEAEDGSFYMFRAYYIAFREIMGYWNIVWLKRGLLTEKTII